MEEKYIDYKYALNLLQRINSLVENNRELSSIFEWQGFNLWQSFQASLFVDAKVWSQEKRLSQAKVSLGSGFKLLVSVALCTLISLASLIFFLISKKSMLIFTDDKIDGNFKNDFRLGALYEALNTERASYMEIVHTILRQDTFKKFLRRKRAVIYLEAIDFTLAPLVFWGKIRAREIIEGLDLAAFDIAEREFVRFELEKMISSKKIVVARFSVFKWLIKILKIEKIFSIDDPRYYNELVMAGNYHRVPTTAIQHGHFTKYHVGWLKMTRLNGRLVRPQKLLVWSEYWKQELLRLGTYFNPEEIIVGGGKSSFAPMKPESGSSSAVLVPYERDAPKKDMREFIEKMLECGNREIIFKLRPDQDKREQLSEYDLLELGDKIKTTRGLEKVMSRVGLVAGTYSTMLYDMVEQLKPVAIIESSIDYGLGMVENGLADLISKKDDVCERIQVLVQTSFEELESRKAKLVGKDDRTLTETLRAIIRNDVPA